MAAQNNLLIHKIFIVMKGVSDKDGRTSTEERWIGKKRTESKRVCTFIWQISQGKFPFLDDLASGQTVQENDLKRARALKKTKAEQELGRQKDKEIGRLTQEIEELRSVVSKQKAIIAKYKVYQKFMERVLDYSEEVIISSSLTVK